LAIWQETQERQSRRTAIAILASNSVILLLLMIAGGLAFADISHPRLTGLSIRTKPGTGWIGYAVAAGGTAVAAFFRWGLESLVGPGLPTYTTFYLVVLVSALIGGIPAGLFATVLTVLTVAVLLLPPLGSLMVSLTADQVGLALFFGMSLGVTLICAALRSARIRVVAEAHRSETSERRLRATFDQAAVGIVEVDTTDRFTAVNERACQILGYTREELLRMDVNGLTFEEDRPLSARLNEDLHRGRRERLDYEKRYLRRDGSPIWVHVTVSSVRDPEGRDLGSIGTFEDISERKKAEAAMQESQSALQKAKEDLAVVNAELERKVQERTARLAETVAELEHFSYTITHDMRAPLRAMKGFSHILLEDAQTSMNFSSRDLIRRIAESAERMDKLITDALDYSKVITHGFQLTPVDAAALLREIVESYPQFHPPLARVEVENHFPAVLGNEAGLTQCFSNLLGNAVKFVQPGKVPHVRVWAEPRGDFVRLWFEDNGIGIPEEYQARIWVMFQRLEKAYEGTGIGLALVRKTAERMGGKAGVESDPGKGSRFWIELKSAIELQPQSAKATGALRRG
jgi:PAS domain S-box-containing protein